MISKLNTQKYDYTNPVGVIYYSLGFQPEDIKKHHTGFGGIFAFFAKIVTKHNKLKINEIQKYKQMKHPWRQAGTQQNDYKLRRSEIFIAQGETLG